MKNLDLYHEKIGMKFQLYNSLFLNLPYSGVKTSGTLLPVFADYCRDELKSGHSPKDIVETFFAQKAACTDFSELKDHLFQFLRLAERQVVLFDALEDAGYHHIHDLEGPGSLKDLFSQIKNIDDPTQLRRFIEEYSVRVVLTAHPTQFYPDQVLWILEDLAKSLDGNDLKMVNTLLQQMGRTRFKKSQKPTPVDEAESLIWILANVMYQVIPRVNARLLEAAFPNREESITRPGIIELGFWPGGDRDGNPFVTADTTLEVASRLKQRVLQLYLEDTAHLKRRLTFDGITALIGNLEQRLDLTLLQAKNPLAPIPADPTFAPFTEPQQLVAELTHIRAEVINNHQGLFVEAIENLIYKVQSFGFHFASLDIRQDSGIHESVAGQLTTAITEKLGETATDYHTLDEVAKQQLLQKLIDQTATWSVNDRKSFAENFISQLEDPVEQDVLNSLYAVQTIQSQNGPTAVHRYITSNTQNASHMLEVRLFAVISGMDNSALPIDIVPLFETIDDLHNAPGVMTTLYENPTHLAHLRQRGSRQPIMLGFSDGTKDGGYLAANWEIYKAKAALTAVNRNYGLRVQFFDGRGGPPARGGGNTHKFYRSLGSEIDNSAIQLTIQGQTITSTYGTIPGATHNLEQLVTAGIENALLESERGRLTPEQSGLIDELSVLARNHYLELKHHPAFVSYLEEMTPLKYYGQTNIGSRPTKRKNTGKLELSGLRAIPFVGAWSQMKQNVPGYYGFGTALQALIDAGREQELIALTRSSLFFRTLIENSMQSLAKASFELTKYIAADADYGPFWQLLYQEAKLTESLLKKISGQSELLSTDPAIRESIRLRENLIVPVTVIQQYALQTIRAFKTEDESAHREELQILEKLVIKSLASSVNASRNSV